MSREEILMHLKECIFDNLSENNYYSKVMEFLPKNVEVESGVTKMVLFFPDTDFVIKIPFRGFTRHEVEWDNEAEEYRQISEEFIPFDCAYTEKEDDNWNYCQVEVETYQAAVEANVQEFLLENKLFATINGQPIYIQEKAEIFEHTKSWNEYDDKTNDDTIKRCKDKDLRCFHACWITDAFQYYQDDQKVLNFLAFADKNLEDLHSGNVGYVNGRPVIIDYGSYHEED